MESTSLEGGSLREVVEQQLELLRRALAFNQVIARHLQHEEDSKPARDGSKGGSDDACSPSSLPSCSALVSALVPLPRNSTLAPEKSARSSMPPLQDLSRPLLPPCNPSGNEPRTVEAGRPMVRAASAMTPAEKKKLQLFRCQSSFPPGIEQLKDEAPRQPEPKQRTLFPSADGIKARVLEALAKPEYNVEAFYKESGFCASLASSQRFMNLTLCVIALNTVWIAVETDYNKAAVLCDAPWIFQVVDNLFCTYFTFEILTRFFAFRRKLDAFRDGWFCFDLVLVLLMVWETWVVVAMYLATGGGGGGFVAGHSSILRILRIFRLTRVARMARLLRGMPELMVLVKGMLEGIRSVSATLVLLVFIIYIFAVMFTQLLSGTEVGAGCFDTVPEAMNCLMLESVFTEQAEFIRKLLEADWKYYLFMLVYLLFTTLTVMNMLIAVLCEVVSVVAQVDKEETAVKELQHKVTSLVGNLGVPDDEEVITKEHFSKLAENPEAMRSLYSVGVDVVALMGMTDFIFRDNDKLMLGDFMQVVLQFRGSNPATVKDVVDMRVFVTKELADLEVRLGGGKA